MINPVSGDRPLKHYQWGENCDSWNLVEENSLSVKLERMPPHTSEQLHYHRQAQQFFFVLKGVASFETEEGKFTLSEREGLHIPAGMPHRILNEGTEELEFILSSQPSTLEDRVNIK